MLTAPAEPSPRRGVLRRCLVDEQRGPSLVDRPAGIAHWRRETLEVRNHRIDGEEPMEASAAKMNGLFYVVSIYMILIFFWRFLIPAYEEAEPDSLIYLEIVLEIVQAVGLIALFSYLRPRYGGASTAVLTVVFLIALAASLGILVMRFSTTHGWYTGHRIYYPGGYRF
ncbi:MAG TPA: hypothetical protein VGR70_03200 [Stellaceae bacterium]|nr:hypothetical protein [Stellaceae bacterium]